MYHPTQEMTHFVPIHNIHTRIYCIFSFFNKNYQFYLKQYEFCNKSARGVCNCSFIKLMARKLVETHSALHNSNTTAPPLPSPPWW